MRKVLIPVLIPYMVVVGQAWLLGSGLSAIIHDPSKATTVTMTAMIVQLYLLVRYAAEARHDMGGGE